MRLGRVASASDPGRKRRQNEDSYVVKPPVFAVADGMGGARAGEVASKLAAGALLDEPPTSAPAEQRVVELVQEANRRVYERAAEDDSVAGMGTTMTVAIVEDGVVTIGHVGDSRAYLVRDGKLTQVTHDHSLVAELMRDGKLSPEEAESHPQRSLITRALGTEPDVDVDTFEVEPRPGDVFLLASDGLSAMVPDDEILAIVEKHRSDLGKAARALIRAANQGGGEDNITVVAFEIAATDDATLEDVRGEPAAEPAVTDGEDDTLSEVSAVPTAEPEKPRTRSRARRRTLIALAVLLVLGAVAIAGVWAISQAHFIGADKHGHVAVFQGLPYDVGGGVKLYRAVYISPVLAAQLTQDERERLFNHHLRSYESARGTLRLYEREIIR
jgi:PPM family protein phosphatase